jgi:rubrerythrin
MPTLKAIFIRFGAEYVRKNNHRMPTVQKRAVSAIANCRSPHSGTTVFKCQSCGKTHSVYRSCGNRHCPGCQHLKQHRWLNNRIQSQLPGHHFMLTFTVPVLIAS